MALISGPILIGFARFFDRAYGDERTPKPYYRVTPSRVGGVLLPFACPHCGAVKPEAVDPRKRDRYCDRSRGFAWCPSCNGRYVLDTDGVPLTESLSSKAISAPARIERGGVIVKRNSDAADGLVALGARR